MAELLWNPSDEIKEKANLTAYLRWLNNRGLLFSDYHKLWEWSVASPEEFWKSLWQYFDIRHEGEITAVMQGSRMPHISWFEGTYLNYAEHIFRKNTTRYPAVISLDEQGKVKEITWQELVNNVSSLQQFLKAQGLQKGDRVAAYLPCIPEATMAFLATASLGAIWSSCSPDFGLQAVLDRFAQIEPVILFTVMNYRYNGNIHDKSDVVQSVVQAIPSIRYVVVINAASLPQDSRYTTWEQAIARPAATVQFERVPFSHPLWVLYSSGTTGMPKAMVHSHGGILLEHLKYLTFHNDIHPGERCFWFTTTGWMMWNYIQSSLLCGGTLVLYDGSPSFPDLNRLWKMADDLTIAHFGTSAAFIISCAKAGINPGKSFKLTNLRSVGSTGSTLPPEGFNWIYTYVKKDVWLASISGGTDVCSAFVGGNPLLPVYAGEIQCRALGSKVEAFDQSGKPVEEQVGEMVITKPLPSMPVYFWNDKHFERYAESYFEMFPGVWRHGDWIKITRRGGVIIYGRSDATLNRAGVRIGTSEIYRAVDKVAEVSDSLIVCIELPGGNFWMPLFVKLKEGVTLTESLKKTINDTIRLATSPRHVPDEIIAIEDIPYTISGKKTETPVKKILMGSRPEEVINPGALRNPESLNLYTKYMRTKQ
jgi:acetoacetyl-CoA synthetase